MPKKPKIIYFYDVLQLSSYSGGWYKVPTLEKAEKFCKAMAISHYENFPVGSLLIPKNKRQDIYNVYAFARIADDIADTLLEYSQEERINFLENYLSNLKVYISIQNRSIYNKHLFNPSLLAAAKTMKDLNIPVSLPERLITAFSMDANFMPPETLENLLNYCHYSANPIGEIILRIFNLENENNIDSSNNLCTALQLTNFWQDFSIDLPNGRSYIPNEILEKYDLNQKNQIEWQKNPNFNLVLNDLYNYTESLYNKGIDLIKYLKPYRLKAEIETTIRGGRYILKKTRELKQDILIYRPKISKISLLYLAILSISPLNIKQVNY